MADWNSPVLTDTYTDHQSDLKDRDLDVAKGMDPASVTVTNPVTGMIRFTSASRKWETYNGASWVTLVSYYDIEIKAFTGDVTKPAGSSALTIATAAVTSAKLRDSAAVSVIGRSANTSGVPADIAAGADDTILRRVASALSWGAITIGMIANSLITYAKIQNVSATDRLLGRSTVGAGVIEEITCTAAGRAILDDADNTAQRTTLGLGSLATLSTVNNGNWSGTALAIANGGTGTTTAALAFAALKQAASDTVSGVLEIATAAEMETGTDVLRAVTPGRVQYHDGVAKCWAYITNAGTPALTASYNAASVTDVAVGNTRVNFATDMSASTAYAEFGTIDSVSGGNVIYHHFTSATARSVGAGRNFITEGAGPAAADLDCCQLFFGDQ